MYYYLGDQDSYLCVITDQQLRYYPLVITPAQGKILFQDAPLRSQPLTCALASRLVDAFNRMLKDDYHKFVRSGRRRAPQPRNGQETVAADTDEDVDAPGEPLRSFEIVASDSLPLPWGRKGLPRDRLRPFGPEQALVLSETLLPGAALNQVRRESYRHTIIVADPALHRLPFQALPVRSGQGERPSRLNRAYVVNRLPPICYAPSIRVFSRLQTRSRNQQQGRYDLTVGGADPRLKAALDECQTFARYFPNQAVRPLLIGSRATEGLLRLYAPQCHLLHLANHADYRAGSQNLTGGLTLFRSPLRAIRREKMTEDSICWRSTT